VRTRIYWVLPAEVPHLDVAGALAEARAELGKELEEEREEAWVL
jgi:hypothetical protein